MEMKIAVVGNPKPRVIPIPQSRERNLALIPSSADEGGIPLPRLRDRNDTGDPLEHRRTHTAGSSQGERYSFEVSLWASSSPMILSLWASQWMVRLVL